MYIPDQFSLVRWLKEDSVALVINEDGKKLVLKENPKAALLADFSETVSQYTRALRGLMPKISSAGNYYYRGLVEGEMAGDTETEFGFKEKNLAFIDPQVIVRSLFELQHLSASAIFANNKLEERKSSWYINNLKETEEAVSGEFDSYYLYNIDQFMRKLSRAVDNNSRCLVNGDLHPQNLFVNCLLEAEAKTFVISDWDLLHFNNPGYDIADLYVWAWKNPVWRERLISEFMALGEDKQNELADYLSFCQVYLSCQMIKHVHLMRERNLSVEAKANAMGLLNSSKNLLLSLVK